MDKVKLYYDSKANFIGFTLKGLYLALMCKYIIWHQTINQLNHFCWSVADEELFEDNPEEYIRRDIEGSGKTIK